jgi:hypothetical protein
MKTPSFLPVFLILLPVFAATPVKKAVPNSALKPVPFVSLMDTSCWKLTKAFSGIEKWYFGKDSVFEGSDGWIGYSRMFGDFVLEGDFLYNGKSQGGVLIRGDRTAWFPNLSGYEMDIDADMPGSGHISFPFRPQPNPGIVPFPVGAWQHFSINAVGQDISVKLNGKDAIKFHDDHYRYGQICLEGEKGGLRFKNLRVQNMDKDSCKGPRSVWTEVFDGSTMGKWENSGSVAIANSAMEIDGSKKTSAITLGGLAVTNGIFEFDVWCKRPDKSLAPYRISFQGTSDSAKTCLTCRPRCILSCGSGKCVSPFPMFDPTTWSEFWRIEVKDKSVSVFRFGEKVLACSEPFSEVKKLSVSADSCLLLVRGVRYKIPEKTVAKAARPVPSRP